jgi:hypothetical protein
MSVPANGARAAHAKGIALSAGCSGRVRGPPATPPGLGHPFRRLAGRRGGKKAAMTVAHTILVLGSPRLREGTCDEETRYDRLPSRQEARPQQRAVKALERLGYRVT